jgi:hypothetical protein
VLTTTLYLWWGKTGASQPATGGVGGQHSAYDDDTIFCAPVGGGANRTAFNITGTDVGGITAGDIAAPSGLLGTQHTDVGDYSTYGDNPDLDLVNTDWTVSFLFRATTSDLEQYILGKYDHTTQNRGYLCIFSGSQHFDLTYQPVQTSYNPIYRLSSGVDVVDGQWHHLAGTFISGTRASVYTEGILRNTTTNNIPSSVASNNASFQIGTQVAAQNQPADFSHVTVHSVARSADWIASNHANFMQGDTLLTGYNYSLALGAVIPYSGNEAAYEAFNSVGGGYFQGDGNAFFKLGQEYLIDVTQPFEIEFKAFYNASYVESFNGLFSPKAGSPGRIIIQNSNRRIYPHGANLPSAVYLGSLIDDANWHTYKIVGDGVDVSFVRDSITERSVGIASYDGGFKYDSLLVNTNEEHPWEHNIAYLSVTKNGVLTHRWDFCHANAAGNDGPDYVLDRVGGVHGVSSSDVSGNWKRDLDLSDVLEVGFNLYTNSGVHPVPTISDNPTIDIFGNQIVYVSTPTLTMEPGVYSVSGSVGLHRHYALSCDPGALAIAGNLDFGAAPRALSCDPGALAIAGNLDFGAAPRALSCDPGALVIVGNLDFGAAPRALSCDPGALVIVGNVAFVSLEAFIAYSATTNATIAPLGFLKTKILPIGKNNTQANAAVMERR